MDSYMCISVLGSFVLHEDTHREARGDTRKYHRHNRLDVLILSEYKHDVCHPDTRLDTT